MSSSAELGSEAPPARDVGKGTGRRAQGTLLRRVVPHGRLPDRSFPQGWGGEAPGSRPAAKSARFRARGVRRRPAPP